MALEFGREKLLYAVGIVLGVVAVAYFGFQLFDQVSPATTAVALFAGFLVFLVAGIATEAELLDVVAYGLAAGCYLVFVAYVLARFDVGDGGTFLLLAASSALFVALGYLAQEGRLELSRRRATLAVLVVALSTLAVVGVDVVSAGASASAEFGDSVEVPERGAATTVGTVTLANPSFLPRKADVPQYHACAYLPGLQPTPLTYESPPGSPLLDGGEARRFDLELPGVVFYTENGTRRESVRDRERVPVETVETCPESAGEPKVVVVEGTDLPRTPDPRRSRRDRATNAESPPIAAQAYVSG